MSKKKQKKAQMDPKKKTAILVAVVAAVFLLCVGIIIAVTRSEGSTGSDNTDQTANDESTADTKDTAENVTADASYFGGPENAGFLYVRKSTGAGEYVSETALSEETLTVMSDMAESLAAKATTFMEEIRPVRNHMCERIFAEIEDVELNGHKDHHLTNHLNIRIKNVSAAVVQKALKEEGIEAGIGTNSNILAAIGRSKAESAESVSFSLKAGTTMEDADKIVDSLKEIVTGERTVL